MREVQVAAVITTDPAQRFLLTYNPKWKGYAFPMRDFNPDTDVLTREAIGALEDDLGVRLPSATATEEDYLGSFCASGRSGEDALYRYWAIDVDPGQPLDLAAANAPDGHTPFFADLSMIESRDDVTWSTKQIARHLVETQEVSMAVVVRDGKDGPEYLLVWNDNYRGYFFPSARVRAEFKPDAVARRAVRSDLGYRGEVVCTWKAEVADIHYSNRYQRDRSYRFHICEALLPGVDLNAADNVLELARRRGVHPLMWLRDGQLPSGLKLSQTLPAVWPTVRNAFASAR